MNKQVRRAATVLAGTGALLAAAITPGQAATPDSAAVAACGSSYYVQERYPIFSGGATVFLLYSSSTQKNCVVTVKDDNGDGLYGVATQMNAGIIASGGSWSDDPGNYSKYAGPRYVYAPGKCVKVRGGYTSYGNGSGGGTYMTYESPWVRCG